MTPELIADGIVLACRRLAWAAVRWSLTLAVSAVVLWIGWIGLVFLVVSAMN